MAPKTPSASKTKSKKNASARSRENVSDKAKRPSKSRTKSTPKPARSTGVQNFKGPKRWTKKQLEKALEAGIERAQIELVVEDLPSKYRHVDKGDGKVPFVEGSEAHKTWGNASTDESTAAVCARRKGGMGGASKRLGLSAKAGRKARTMTNGMAGGILLDEDEEIDWDDENGTELEAARLAKEEEGRIAKFGGRCFFMELPNEIREEVYGWLLIKPQPILVLSNWTAVLRVAGVTFDNNIFLVNHLIGQEASKYFYQHSSFHALVRSNPLNWRHRDWIEQPFIKNFRDLVVDVVDMNIGVSPEETPMHESLDALRMADCQLNSVTIALSPYVIQNQMAQTALMGVVADASGVAYADWFKKGANIHRVLTNTKGLRCREMFVVLKLKAQGRHGRVVVRIDGVHLPQNFQRSQIIDSWEVYKERVIRWADAAKKDVEQIAEDIVMLSGWASAGLSWDGIRVNIAEHEKKRLEKGRDEGGPRMRVMGEDEDIVDLKWWTREKKAEKRAAEKKKLKGLTEALAQTSIGTADEMDVHVLFGPLPTINQAENGDDQQQEPMEDVQPTSISSQDATPAALPATPASFVQIPDKSAIGAGVRARRHRLREIATVEDLLSARASEPEPEAGPDAASEPEPLPPALPGSLQAVFDACASAPEIPEFNIPDALVTAPGPFAVLVMGRNGEVNVAAVADGHGVAGVPRDDGKIGEEEVEGKVQREMGGSGAEQAADDEGLFFPHVVNDAKAHDDADVNEGGMAGDGVGGDGAMEDVHDKVDGDEALGELEQELMAAEGEESLFPDDIDDSEMVGDAHMGEDGTEDHRVGGALGRARNHCEGCGW